MLVFMDLALSSGAQTISQVFSQNSPKCIGTLKQEEVLPLELRGEHNSWKIMLHNNSPKLYTWHRIPLAVTKPCFRAFVASCLTALHPTLCIVLGDVSLGCSCSAIETQSVKLPVDCSWANLTVTWSLESYVLQPLLTSLCDCTWPTTSWLSSCQSLPFFKYH